MPAMPSCRHSSPTCYWRRRPLRGRWLRVPSWSCCRTQRNRARPRIFLPTIRRHWSTPSAIGWPSRSCRPVSPPSRAMRSLNQLKAEFARGGTSRALVEQCLSRIADSSGEGGRVFLKVNAAGALSAADYYDHLRAHGAAPSPFAGIPVSIKDLFDVAGEVTTAGSVVLRDAAAAAQDAPCVARLRAAGYIPIGRTNMTEFAFSGLGINPHYGTPLNSYDRAAGRIPGGSSSGAAVSVTDGMAFGALGTDPGRFVRHRWVQADRAPGPDRRRVPPLYLARFGRTARGHSRLLRRARRRSRGRAGR